MKTLTRDDKSLVIRALFTYMGYALYSGDADEYEKAKNLLVALRKEQDLSPMSEGMMRAYAHELAYSRRGIYGFCR